MGEWLKEIAGESRELSLSATEDVIRLLYGILEFPILSKTDKGSPSTDRDTIEMLKDEWVNRSRDPRVAQDVLEAILNDRLIRKHLTSYIRKIPRSVQPDGFIHTTYKVGAAATGRTLSEGPSVHTLPNKSVAKKAFVSRFPGGLYLKSDYAQLELCVAAAVSRDEALRGMIIEGQDVHRLLAAEVLNKSQELVTSSERRIAKTVVFGVLYGRQAASIAKQYKLSEDRANGFIRKFFDWFPGIREYVESQHAAIDRGEVLYSATGRVYPISNKGDREAAKRQAVNYKIQGPASDITQLALNQLNRRRKAAGWESKIIVYVHDEIGVDVAPGELMMVLPQVDRCMTDYAMQVCDFMCGVPLRADHEVGASWGGVMDVKAYDKRSIEMDGDIGDFYQYKRRLQEGANPPRIEIENVYEVVPEGDEFGLGGSKENRRVVFRTIFS